MIEERPSRQPTAVDRVAEDWVTTLVDLDPTVATYIGVPGRTGEYGDTSPAGAAAMAEAAAAAKRALDAAEATDDVDRVTKADLGAELDLVAESYARKLHLRDLNVIASPPRTSARSSTSCRPRPSPTGRTSPAVSPRSPTRSRASARPCSRAHASR